MQCVVTPSCLHACIIEGDLWFLMLLVDHHFCAPCFTHRVVAFCIQPLVLVFWWRNPLLSENVSTATESCMRGLAKHTWVGLIPSRWNQPMVPARCACIAVSAYAKCSQCNPSMRMGGTSNARPLHHSTQHTALFSLDINVNLNAAHRTCFGCCTTHIGTLANQLMFNRSGLLHSTMPSQCTSHIEQ